MEPIVSPIFIYLLGVVNTVNFLLAIVFIAALIGIAVFWITWAIITAEGDKDEEDEAHRWGKLAKKATIIALICALIGIVVPSKNTLIGMYVAKNITVDNIEKAIEAGNSVREVIKQDVFELIEKLKDKE